MSNFLLLMDKFDRYDCESKKSFDIMNILSNDLVTIYLNFLAENYSQGTITKSSVDDGLSNFRENFTMYAFYDKNIKREYVKSNEYFDITSKLSYTSLQKLLKKH